MQIEIKSFFTLSVMFTETVEDNDPQPLRTVLERLVGRNFSIQDADLQGANLQDANLQDANLQDANLQDANLQGANLQGVNLQYADLRWTDFRDADVKLGDPEVPVIENLDAKILARIVAAPILAVLGPVELRES